VMVRAIAAITAPLRGPTTPVSSPTRTTQDRECPIYCLPRLRRHTLARATIGDHFAASNRFKLSHFCNTRKTAKNRGISDSADGIVGSRLRLAFCLDTSHQPRARNWRASLWRRLSDPKAKCSCFRLLQLRRWRAKTRRY
jgi:hypothetical protein